MAISAFEILEQVAGSFNINNPFFSPAIDFSSSTPDSATRVIQIQLTTDQASVLEVTFNGGASWSLLNNGTAILGLATFTMLVFSDTELNFRNTDVAGLAVSATVAA